jgi:hypothetical protein
MPYRRVQLCTGTHFAFATALCLSFLLCFSCLFSPFSLCLCAWFLNHLFTVFLVFHLFSSILLFFSFYFPYFIFYLSISIFYCIYFSLSSAFLLYSCHYLCSLISACFFILSISSPSSPSSLQLQRNQQTRARRAYTLAISEHNLRIST